MNNEFKDYYKILGVTPRASFENIRGAAERELSQNWNNAIGRLEIQEAYEVLADPERRKEYDLEFSKRLNEREVAIRNARTFEEYMAAQSLHPELANVDVAPEVTVPPVQTEETQINKESVGQDKDSAETEEKGTANVDLGTNDVINNSTGDNTESSHDSEETQESEKEQQQEAQQEQEQEQEQEKTEKEEQQEEKEQEQEKTEKEQEQEEKEQEQEQEQEQQQEAQQEQEQEQQEQEQEQQEQEESEKEQEQEQEEKKENKFKLSNEELENLEKRRFNKKQRVKRTAIIIGSAVFFGPLGGVAAAIITKKSGKFKLQKIEKKGILKEVRCGESELIQQYNDNLEKEISKLLNKESKSDIDNYKLEIAKLRYKNNVELLNARINAKVGTVDELGMKAHNRLHLLALKGTLKVSMLRLELMKKIAEGKVGVLEKYTPSKSNDKLSKLNEEIGDLTEELDDNTMSKRKRDRKTLKIRKLNRQRLETINKMELKRNGISRGQLFLATVNSITNRKKDNVVVEQVEQEEQPKLSK